MIKGLSRFELGFLISNLVVYSIDFIFLNIFNFYVWEKSDSLNTVFYFNIVMIIFIVVGIIISELLLQRLNSIVLRIFALFLFVPFGIVTLTINEPTTTILTINGIFIGLNFGLRSQSYYIIFRNYISSANRAKFDSLQMQLNNIRSILVPIIISQMISITNSYYLTFFIGFILIGAAAVPLIIAKKIPEAHTSLSIFEAINTFKNRNDLFHNMVIKFLEGINQSFQIVILSIVSLYLLGDLGFWGIFSAATIFLQILVSQYVGKKLNLKSSPLALGIITALYAIGSIVLANYFSISGIILFTILSVPFNALYFTSTLIIIEKSLDFYLLKEQFSDEIYASFEFSRSLGRILPLVILFILRPDFQDPTILKVVVLIFGFSVFLIFTQSLKMNVVKKKSDPFLHSD